MNLMTTAVVIAVAAALVIIGIVLGLMIRRAIVTSADRQIEAAKQIERERFNPLGLKQTLRWLEQNARFIVDDPSIADKARLSRALNAMQVYDRLANLMGAALENTATELTKAQAQVASSGSTKDIWEKHVARLTEQLASQQQAFHDFTERCYAAGRLANQMRPSVL